MKKILFILLLPLTLFGQSQKISDMTSATSLTGSEYVPIVQTTNKKATVGLLRGWTSLGTAGQLLKVNSGATALEFFTPSYLTALTNGNGTTANGSAVDLGGTATGNISINDSASGTNLFYIGQGTKFQRFDSYTTQGASLNVNNSGTYRTYLALGEQSAYLDLVQNPSTIIKSIGFDATGVILNLGSDATGDTYYRNSSGYFTRLAAGTNGHVLTLAGGIPSWAAPSGGSSVLSALTAATGSNTINNAANAQEWRWNSLASETGFLLSSSSTAAASNTQTVFRVNQTGANASSTQTTYGGYFSNTKTGTSSTNVGLYATASGGSSNTAIQIGAGDLKLPSAAIVSLSSGLSFIQNSTTPQGNSLFIGQNSGSVFFSGTNGFANLAVGTDAGKLMQTSTASRASSNTLIGYRTAEALTTGSFNTTLGTVSGSILTTQDGNTFIGYHSGLNSTGENNTGVGRETLRAATASNLVAIGYGAGYSNTSGQYNVSIGYNSQNGVTNGGKNTTVGYNTGISMSSQEENTFLGYRGGETSTGSYNTIIGSGAGRTATGSSNLFVGREAAAVLTVGTRNTIIGHNGLQQATGATGSTDNVYIGERVAQTKVSGSENIVIGRNITTSTNSASNELNIGGVLTGTGLYGSTGTLTYTGSNMFLTGDLGSTGTRVTKGWFTGVEIKGSGTGTNKSLLTEDSGGNDRFYVEDDGSVAIVTAPTKDNAATQILTRNASTGEIEYKDRQVAYSTSAMGIEDVPYNHGVLSSTNVSSSAINVNAYYSNKTTLYVEVVVVAIKTDGTSSASATVSGRFRKDNSGTFNLDANGTVVTSDAAILSDVDLEVNGTNPAVKVTMGGSSGDYEVSHVAKTIWTVN